MQLTPELEEAVAREFLAATRPMSDRGKLGAYLLQLTPSFAPKDHKLEELDSLLAQFARFRVGVELRHRGWVTGDRLAQTEEFFTKRNVTFVSIDAPASEHFMTMPGVDLLTNPDLAYLRLHGRNLQGYLAGKTVAERFNYLYSDQELEAVAARAAKLAARTSETHVLYNNNASDYALRNAATFQKILARDFAGMVNPPVKPVSEPAGPGWSRTLEFDFGTRNTKP